MVTRLGFVGHYSSGFRSFLGLIKFTFGSERVKRQRNVPIQIPSIFLRFKVLPDISYYFNATDLKLDMFTYLFLIFRFLVFAKSQVLNNFKDAMGTCTLGHVTLTM